MNNFRNKPLEERKKFVDSILEKHKGCLPILIEKANNGNSIIFRKKEDGNKQFYKFIVPEDMTVAQLLYTLRTRIKLAPSEAIFIFFKENLISTNTLLKEVYNLYKEEDGILYANYSNENTFG
jgi:GABA(A) receptor-associated protein